MRSRREYVRAMRAVESWTRISRCVCLTGTAMEPFLIAAVTGRALAASAARSGVPVVVLDCFADRDTRGLARRCRCAGLVYGSGFEGRTGLLGRLARGRRLYGNEPSVVAAVKDVRRFLPLLDRLGIRYPETRFTAPPPPPSPPRPPCPRRLAGKAPRRCGRRPCAPRRASPGSGRRLFPTFRGWPQPLCAVPRRWPTCLGHRLQ